MSAKPSLKTNVTSLVFCLVAAWLGAFPFISHLGLRLLLVLPASVLLARSLNRWLHNRRQIFIQVQFKRLLEHLLARMTAGATLEKSFSDAPTVLEPLLGAKSDLLAALRQLERQLAVHQPLESLLPRLSRCLPCDSAALFLQILPSLRQAGGLVSQYIREELRQVVERINLVQETSADTTQRRTEALILTLMPFAMSLMLRYTPALDLQTSGVSSATGIGMAFAYGIAMTAAVAAMSILGQDNSQPRILLNNHLFRPCLIRKPCRAAQLLDHLYKDILPDTYGLKLVQILQDLPAYDDNLPVSSARAVYFANKLTFTVLGLFFGLLLALVWSGQWYWIIALPVGCNLLQDQQLFRLERSRHTACRLEYPVFINLIASLLQTGLSLHAAVTIGLKVLNYDPVKSTSAKLHRFTKRQTSSEGLSKTLRELGKQLQLGLPVDNLFDKLALSCPVPEIQAALSLFVRFARLGGQEILNLLAMQSAQCWSLYRQSVRRQLERQSVMLLLPMMLDLLAVVLIATLPALLSLQGL